MIPDEQSHGLSIQRRILQHKNEDGRIWVKELYQSGTKPADKNSATSIVAHVLCSIGFCARLPQGHGGRASLDVTLPGLLDSLRNGSRDRSKWHDFVDTPAKASSPFCFCTVESNGPIGISRTEKRKYLLSA